jgi:hypothetical protein
MAYWKARTEKAEERRERACEQAREWKSRYEKAEADLDYWKRKAKKVGEDLSFADLRSTNLESEVQRLRNKLNADSQNFEIECLKAQARFWKQEWERLRGTLKELAAEDCEKLTSKGGCLTARGWPRDRWCWPCIARKALKGEEERGE